MADGGIPPLTDIARVAVTVEHNLQTPVFGHSTSLSIPIPETTPVGTNIISVNASDSDSAVSFVLVFFRNIEIMCLVSEYNIYFLQGLGTGRNTSLVDCFSPIPC